MGGFATVRQLGKPIADYGPVYESYWCRTASPTAAASRFWVDCSVATGNPKYQAYAGAQYEATALVGSANNGLFTGALASGQENTVASVQIASGGFTGGCVWILLDYLMFYPLIDCDSTDEQIMVNDVSLPRYSDGAGVNLMIVTTIAQTIGAPTRAWIRYVGDDDQERTAQVWLKNSNVGGLNLQSASAATVDYSTPFLWGGGPRQGIKRVLSFQLESGLGGFVALVLVKPLWYAHQVIATAAIEHEAPKQMLPFKTQQGAFLGFIASFFNATSVSNHLRLLSLKG